MSKIHYFQRYSTHENTVTNNTLQLFARIYEYSASRASGLLYDITGEEIEIGIEIKQQERVENAIPDGAIIQRSFKILIESKVDSGNDQNQLLRHAGKFSGESKQILLLLTKQKIDKNTETNIKRSIHDKYPSVIFSNVTYKKICDSLGKLFEDYESEMKALAEDYIEYCNDEKLFDQSRYLMRIVPCGQSMDINKKYGIYFHPSDRGYTKHQYIGIYKGKKVRYLWEIDTVYDIEYNDGTLNKKIVQGRETNDYDEKLISIINDAKTNCGYNISTGHRFFCGNPMQTNFIKETAGGIQGSRFINLKEVLGEYTDADEVAKKLYYKTWK